MTPEQLLAIYAQHIENLKDPDETGLDEELVLLTRSSVAGEDWTPEQRRQIDRLDDKLVTYWRSFSEVLPNPNYQDRAQWWWFLNEGPQVRKQTKVLA